MQKKISILWKVGSFLIENDAKEKKEAECFFFFTKGEEMSRVGSRDRHLRWRSKITIKNIVSDDQQLSVWFWHTFLSY